MYLIDDILSLKGKLNDKQQFSASSLKYLMCTLFYYIYASLLVWRFFSVKWRCDKRFTAYGCAAFGSNQGNYFENTTTYSKRMRKTLVATQLYLLFANFSKSKLLLINILDWSKTIITTKRTKTSENVKDQCFNLKLTKFLWNFWFIFMFTKKAAKLDHE